MDAAYKQILLRWYVVVPCTPLRSNKVDAVLSKCKNLPQQSEDIVAKKKLFSAKAVAKSRKRCGNDKKKIKRRLMLSNLQLLSHLLLVQGSVSQPPHVGKHLSYLPQWMINLNPTTKMRVFFCVKKKRVGATASNHSKECVGGQKRKSVCVKLVVETQRFAN